MPFIRGTACAWINACVVCVPDPAQIMKCQNAKACRKEVRTDIDELGTDFEVGEEFSVSIEARLAITTYFGSTA